MHKILIIFLFIQSGIGFAQTKHHLVADFYPDHIPSEIGTELEEFEDRIHSFNVIYIRNINRLLDIDSLEIQLNTMLLYAKAKIDTTILDIKNNVTKTIRKDSITNFSPMFPIIHENTKEELNINSLFLCKNSKPKYIFRLEEKSKDRMNYKLYYLPNCEIEQLKDENIIRFGEIKLKNKVKHSRKSIVIKNLR